MRKSVQIFFLIGSMVLGMQAFAGQDKWDEHRSGHFLIYSKDIPEDFIKAVETASEEHYLQIANNLGFRRDESWVSERRAKIYIYQDAEDYVSNAMQNQWSHGAAFASQKTIRTFPAAHGFFDSTLPHEIGHIIFREFIGLEPEVPLWFEEGVAMYQEKAKRFGAHQVVKKAVENGEFIALNELTVMRLYNSSPAGQLELFYAESASIVYYIISELGEYNFVRFCRALKEGKTFQRALENTYSRFRSIDDLNRAWLNYLEKIN